MGNRSGPAHADGRRGYVYAEGDVDEEWPRWFSKAMRQKSVPPQLGPFYVYAGPAGGELELVWTNAITSVEEVTAADAQRASELAVYGTVANALAARKSEVERLEQRLLVLQEQTTSTEGRLARLQEKEELLERGLVDERKRVADEKSALAADMAATRELVRAEKQQAIEDMMATKRILREDLSVAVKHITGLTDELMTLEKQTAENAMARRSLGHTNLHTSLDLLDAVEDAHRLSLGGPPRETAGDRMMNVLADSIKTGKIVNIIEGVGNAFRGKKKDEDDDEDEED